LIALIERKVGKQAIIEHYPFPAADMMANLADVTKAGKLLGWEANVGMEEGIERAIAWYNEHRAWAVELDTGN